MLYSGGKDSNLALLKAVDYGHGIACLLSLKPSSTDSEVFHFPNVNVTELQAKAMDLPLISVKCGDDESSSMISLKDGLRKAKEFGVEGVVTGAIRSTYQASRFQKVCDELGLWCFNPLWLRDELSVLKEVVKRRFDVVIVRVAGIDSKFLGKRLDENTIRELEKLRGYANPAGEGGEYETLVLDMPLFKKKIVLEDFEITGRDFDATMIVKKAYLSEKS